MSEQQLPRRIRTAVVGAGQAGLAMSWHLRQAGREHVLLERRETLGGGWQDRWDRFCLVSPNWTSSLPGYPYDGSDPGGFMPRDAITARIAGYADVIGAPVVRGTEVRRLSQPDGGRGFRLETSRGVLEADEVVVATGGFHVPRIPGGAAAISPGITQLHSHHYRNEAALPPGGVLLVGTGQSGVQIAEELHAAGRSVTLSVGKAGRVPRQYRGQDVFVWLNGLLRQGPTHGVSMLTLADLPSPLARFAGTPHLSGHDGGHDTNLRRFAASGIRLVGRFDAADGTRLRWGDDLPATLTAADQFFDMALRPRIDRLIERAGIAAPPDDRQGFTFNPPVVRELDLAAEGISTIIWTTGYRLDYRWIDLPVLDELGVPVQDRGVSPIPGLFFIGLPWQSTMASATLFGVGVDAADLAARW